MTIKRKSIYSRKWYNLTYFVNHVEVGHTYQLSVIRTLTEGVVAASCEYHYSRYKYAHLKMDQSYNKYFGNRIVTKFYLFFDNV